VRLPILIRLHGNTPIPTARPGAAQRLQHRLRRRVAILRQQLQRLQDRVIQPFGYPLGHVPRIGKAPLGDAARQHLIHQNTHAVEVGALVPFPTLLLGRHVRERPHHRCLRLASHHTPKREQGQLLRTQLPQAEVPELRHAF